MSNESPAGGMTDTVSTPTPERRARNVVQSLLEMVEQCRPSTYAPWREVEKDEMEVKVAFAIREAAKVARTEALREAAAKVRNQWAFGSIENGYREVSAKAIESLITTDKDSVNTVDGVPR